MSLLQNYRNFRKARDRRVLKIMLYVFGSLVAFSIVVPVIASVLGHVPEGKTADRVIPRAGETVPEARARVKLEAMTTEQRIELCAQGLATLQKIEPEAVQYDGEVGGDIYVSYINAIGKSVSACRLTTTEVQLAEVRDGKVGTWGGAGSGLAYVKYRLFGNRCSIWAHMPGEGQGSWSRDFEMGAVQ